MDSYTKMFVNESRIHGIKVTEISLLTSNIQEHHPRHRSKSREINLKRSFNIFTKMKLFVTFLLTAMVTIAMEKCIARYLLVEVEDG